MVKRTEPPPTLVELHYVWRDAPGRGRALGWWLEQLGSEITRRALLEQHAGLIL